MNTAKSSPIEIYIARCDPDVRPRLLRMLATARKAAAGAEEIISYKMPAFRYRRNIFYFAAFKNHIGAFPPVRAPQPVIRALKKFMGPKGNLQFPHDKPIPFAAIEKLIRFRVAEENMRQAPKRAAGKRALRKK